MPRKLDLAAIIESTLKSRIGQFCDFTPASHLGDLLLTPDDRTWFQEEIRVRVNSEGFTIELADIPIEPHFTIHDIAASVTGSALPGNAGLPDPD